MSKQIKYYSLTHPQKAIWYTDKMYPNTSINNVAGTLRIKGKIDYSILEKAINIFIQKNDGMRLRVVEKDSESKQYVADYTYKEFDFYDFSGSTLEELYKWDEKQTRIPFELIDSDLFYFALIKINDDDGGFYVKTHHLISDAWSMTLLGSQIVEYYHALKDNIEIISDNISYTEYILSEQEYKKSNRFKKDKEYWDKVFENPPEMTTIKVPNTNFISPKSRRKTLLAPIKFTTKLRQYCSDNKMSPFTLFMSALSMYINRICAKKDITLGTTILNRSNTKEKNMVGMFISTAPVRINVDDNLNFMTFSNMVAKENMSVLRHQKYPYDMLLREVRERHKTTDNIYDIVLSYQNSKFDKSNYSDYETRWHFNGHQTNSLTIHINDREDEGHLIIDYDYQSNLFYVKEIEFIHQHIISLLWHALDNPNKQIKYLDMLSEREKNKILYEFNNTSAVYPKDKTIHQLFEEQVEKAPNNVAVVFEGKQLTYKELNEKSNQLARTLRYKGVKPDSIVGIMVHRSLEMIIGIMGILKAGGAYLPLDPEYPKDRIKYMLEDSAAKVLLTEASLKNSIEFDGEIIDLWDKSIYSEDKSNLENLNKSNDLVYIIYTSGSTGKPKGVMIEHKGLNNFVKGITPILNFSEDNIVLSVTTISFDIFVFEVFTSFLNGAKVVLANQEEQKAPKALKELILNNDVTKILTTPSRMRLLLSEKDIKDYLINIKEIMLGGEELSKDLLDKLRDVTTSRIINGYGPTEITIGATFKDVTDSDIINIGKPILNTCAYILDENSNLVPIGIQGELCIGGEGVARGYLNRSQLTKEKFVDNPFVQGEKIYKTGDIARWYSQGEISFIGRVDQQVKIRGLRIELDEIKNQLLKYENVNDAVVTAREDSKANKYLCAYIVEDREIDITELRKSLLKELPQYMIPSYFVKIDKLPITSNGKVDVKLLPEPKDMIISKVDYVSPSDELEKQLVSIWEDVLEINPIGVLDDFFDLGGDSLSVVDMASRIGRLTNKQIQISSIYENRTVRKIATLIKNEETNKMSNDIILLRRGTSDKNIFFIHGGSGSIGGYANIFKNDNIPLNEEYNCYAIKFDKLDGYGPVKISIEELAQEYIKRIQLIQPDGEYYLAGWCIGGQIIYEMATILDNKLNKQVNSVIMFNSIAPKEWDLYYNFELSNEITYIEGMLNGKFNLDGIDNVQSMRGLWQHIIESIKDRGDEMKALLPKEILHSIPNYQNLNISEIMYYINTMRSLHNARYDYFPKNKLRSQVYFFHPLKDSTIDNHEQNINRWQRYCHKEIHKIEVNADEHSIFDEDINDTIKMLNNILL